MKKLAEIGNVTIYYNDKSKEAQKIAFSLLRDILKVYRYGKEAQSNAF